LKKISEDMTNYNIKHASKLTSFPWVCAVAISFGLDSQVITHHEEAACRGFLKDIPSAIVFVARYVLPWIYYRYIQEIQEVDRSYWRWSPCDIHSVMKPTANVGTLKRPFSCV
jgi:hypothetical protein